MVNQTTIQLVNDLRIEISKSFSHYDNEVNHYLLQFQNGQISEDDYEKLTNPLYSEMKKLKDFALSLREFRISYSEKNLN